MIPEEPSELNCWQWGQLAASLSKYNFKYTSCDWQQQYEWLTSVPGVGRVVATTLLAVLPELGQLSTQQLTSLVGLAPLNYDSGKMRGQRHIVGGRALVRSALYMAALVVVQHNPVISAFYHR